MLFKTNKKIVFMHKKNVNKSLTKTLLQLTYVSSSVFVINFEQVNASWEMSNVITISHFNA